MSLADLNDNQEKTFHSFTDKGEFKIDYIFVKYGTTDKTIYSVLKDSDTNKKKYPSDHFPILTKIYYF